MADSKSKSSRWLTAVLIIIPITVIALLVAFELTAVNSLPDDQIYKPLTFTNPELDQLVHDKVLLQIPFPTDMTGGPDGNLYLTCKNAITILSGISPHQVVKTIKTNRDADLIAVDKAGSIYTCCKNILRRLDINGAEQMQVKIAGDKFQPGDIAVTETDVFIADCGTPRVLRISIDGKKQSEIPSREDCKAEASFKGYHIPSPYMSLLTNSKNLLHVTNTGRHCIEIFDTNGIRKPKLVWGKFSHTSPAGFTGCCNPVSIAATTNDYIVTVEKGTPRVKLYKSDGSYKGLLASAKRLAPVSGVMTATALPGGRIFVLNPGNRVLHSITIHKSLFENN